MIAVFASPEQGVITGGWGFVWAAYGATWLFLFLYATSLLIRRAESHPEDVP